MAGSFEDVGKINKTRNSFIVSQNQPHFPFAQEVGVAVPGLPWPICLGRMWGVVDGWRWSWSGTGHKSNAAEDVKYLTMHSGTTDGGADKWVDRSSGVVGIQNYYGKYRGKGKDRG